MYYLMTICTLDDDLYSRSKTSLQFIKQNLPYNVLLLIIIVLISRHLWLSVKYETMMFDLKY